MASCTCHVLCGTKRLRLERIVRAHPMYDESSAMRPGIIVQAPTTRFFRLGRVNSTKSAMTWVKAKLSTTQPKAT